MQSSVSFFRSQSLTFSFVVAAGLVTSCRQASEQKASDSWAAQLAQSAPAASSPASGQSTGSAESNSPTLGTALVAAPALTECTRTITANVAAIDQVLTFNRFGSYDPAGMIYVLERDLEPIDSARPISSDNVRLRTGKRPRPLVLRANVGDCLTVYFRNLLRDASQANSHSPKTREASFHVNGLSYANLGSDGAFVGYNSDSTVPIGGSAKYTFYAEHEGTFLAYSMGASFGGEGHGGSTVHGLFGAINVEPAGSNWYRSQVTSKVMQQVVTGQVADPAASNPPILNYEATDSAGNPILNMLNANNEIVASDLTAVINGFGTSENNTPISLSNVEHQFREFTILFHDEMHTEYPEKIKDLLYSHEPGHEDEILPEYHGVRDAFGINYGAAGLGVEVLANRAQIGPTKDCVECKYEEFFLESWAGGDPALNVERDASGAVVAALYPDDPSNVYHSYLGDPVRIRNLHAGPKETHVFHLHAHQWLYSPANDKSTYLDSQTIGPGGAFSYDIGYNGGNKNFSVGDSIFHCHLYPHFAQGMWALWRNHDVLEMGDKARRLPDAEIKAGTPNPGVVPLPKRAMAPMPTYADTRARPAMPGYPFYIAGVAGHRTPQPPYDFASLGATELNGGLPRHVITSVPAATFGAPGSDERFKVILDKANLKLLPSTGTPAEERAIQFHAGAFPGATPAVSLYGWAGAAYPSYTSSGDKAPFMVNGMKPAAGAPFADPCPAALPTRLRKYSAAYIEQDIVVNKAKWHDPQGRFIALRRDLDSNGNFTKTPEPFFFRANSNECIEFEATNLMPAHLKADDFQLYAPTDMVGQHIHLVKFDVTASDGAGNGWNYEDGTFAPEEVIERINAANAMGGAFVADGQLTETGARQTLAPVQNALYPSVGKAIGAQTTVQRWYADPLLDNQGNDRTLRTVFTHDHFGPSNHQQHGFYGALVVEPPGSKWYDPFGGVQLGANRDDGGPTSWQAIIKLATAVPPQKSTYREFNLAFADFGIVYDAVGNPINPPTQHDATLPLAIRHDANETCGRPRCPEAISAGDPGTGFINYRQEPIPLRIADQTRSSWSLKSGPQGDLSNVFSSLTHGDPFTPILYAYSADDVQVRLIQGAQEEQHAFTLSGHKWVQEPGDPDTGYKAGQAIGISEHSEFLLSRGVKPGASVTDFLYSSAPTDDLWNGMWGLVRIFNLPRILEKADGVPPRDEKKPLIELATNPRIDADVKDKIAEERAPLPVFDSCPANLAKRTFEVHAILADKLPGGRLNYNRRYKLYDPDAILYVEKTRLDAVLSGAREPEPLILRARAGECIEVTLFNDLPKEGHEFLSHWNYNPPITEGFNTNQTSFSREVGLEPQMVAFDPRVSGGGNIGYNLDAALKNLTVSPGTSRRYVWFAGEFLGNLNNPAKTRPIEFGVVNLRDLADVVNHGMHGGGGVLIVEPQKSKWVENPAMDAQALVTYVNERGIERSFVENVLIYQDELALSSPLFSADPTRNGGTEVIENNVGEDDAEDTGHKGFNYKTEPLWARAGLKPEDSDQANNMTALHQILSSTFYGDPETPIFSVPPGAEMRIRVAQFSGHNRQHAMTVHGHYWPRQPWVAGSRSSIMGRLPNSCMISAQDGITSSSTWNLNPVHGAGGPNASVGDYLYRDVPFHMFADGAWGLVRVQNQGIR